MEDYSRVKHVQRSLRPFDAQGNVCASEKKRDLGGAGSLSFAFMEILCVEPQASTKAVAASWLCRRMYMSKGGRK